jgi:hypothetical protein
MLVRLALAVLAVVVVAWLGVMLRDTRTMESAGAVLFRSPPPSSPEFRRALSDMESAQFLNPDTNPRIYRARFLLLRKQDHAALALANDVVAAEPANINAWSVVFDAAQQVDPPRAAQARTEIVRLSPLISRGRR